MKKFLCPAVIFATVISIIGTIVGAIFVCSFIEAIHEHARDKY